MIIPKDRQALLAELYLNKADIQRLFGVNQKIARDIYNMAEEIDMKEPWRVYDYKVRLTSCCKVTGITLNTLRKQIKSAQELSDERRR